MTNCTTSRRLHFEPLEGRRLLATLFRINAGGPELAGSPVWQADTLAAPSPFNNAASGGNSGTNTTAAAINMTHASIPAGTPMALFQTERVDKAGGASLLWDFPVSPGQYEVRLYFAETWSGAFANGARVFDVAIEGATALDNYDVFADVGARAGVMKSFTVTSDANLDIDFLRVAQNPAVKGIEILTLGAGAAKVEVFSQGSIDNSSTAKVDSFRFHNNSAGGGRISSISVNLSTSFMPDVVYDPLGTAGDVAGIAFSPDNGRIATGQSAHQFTLPRDGGFDKLEVFFTNFDPGETFTFHVDVDPTSVKGSAQPGPLHAASISGLELSGATVTIHFADGGEMAGQLFALDEGASFYKVHSEIVINEGALPSAPSLSVVGVGSAPTIVSSASQTVRIFGPAGATARLLQTEAALHLAGVPGGGFDVDPFEANKVIFVRDDLKVIGAGGFVDVVVTLRDSLSAGGLNYFVAVVDLPDGRTSNVSNVIKIALNNLPPGSNPGSPLAVALGPAASHASTDYSDDGTVDATNLLTWQRMLGSQCESLGSGAYGDGNGMMNGDDLAKWQDSFGASFVESPEVDVDLSELWNGHSSTFRWALPGDLRRVTPIAEPFTETASPSRPADYFFSTISDSTERLRFAHLLDDGVEPVRNCSDESEVDGFDEFHVAFAILR